MKASPPFEQYRSLMGCAQDRKQDVDVDEYKSSHGDLYFSCVERLMQEVVCVHACPPYWHVYHISSNYEQVWGRSCLSLYQDPQSWIQSVHPEDRGMVEHQFQSHDVVEPRTINFRIVLPSGVVRWIHAESVVFCVSQATQQQQMMTLYKDVTLMHSLRQSNGQLVRQSHMMQQIIADLHEATATGPLDWLGLAQHVQVGCPARRVDVLQHQGQGQWNWLAQMSLTACPLISPSEIYAHALGHLQQTQQLWCTWDPHSNICSQSIEQPITHVMYAIRNLQGVLLAALVLQELQSPFHVDKWHRDLQSISQMFALWLGYQQVDGLYQRTEQRLSGLLHTMPQAAVWNSCTSKGQITQARGGIEQILQMPLQAIQHHEQGWLAAIHQEDRIQILRYFRQSHPGESFQGLCRLQQQDQGLRWLQLYCQPMDVAQAVHRKTLLCIGVDVTATLEQKHLQQQLELAHQHIQARNTMLAHVAHDLGAPLSSILFTTRTMERLDVAKTIDHYLQRMVRSAQRMGHLLRDLLLVTQFESGTFSVQKSLHDISLLLRQALTDLSSQVKHQGMVLHLAYIEPQCWMQIDPYRFLQMIDNGLKNALEHNPPGTQIVIDLRAYAQYVQLSIKDTGPGIDPNVLSRLFVPFWQRKQKYSTQGKFGTGLGLSIVQHLVQCHGGQLAIRSQPHQGTELMISLPRT